MAPLLATGGTRYFYPRSPCGERHNINSSVNTADKISIHALLAESDLCGAHVHVRNAQFLSTLSLRRATIYGFCEGGVSFAFLSTLSLRRATVHYDNYNLHCVISIHALLAESDPSKLAKTSRTENISIHALLAESDWWLRCWQLAARDISIHALLAESDNFRCSIKCAICNFYPRSPCGERHNINSSVNTADQISIHALLAESDVVVVLHIVGGANFYPRSPCGERRCFGRFAVNSAHFYPRSPCGERRKSNKLAGPKLVFLSTLSLRRATG